MGDLTRMKDYLASKRQETVSRHPAGKRFEAPSFAFMDGIRFAISVVEKEQAVMKKSGGATFGRNKEYDRGYDTALRDLKILLTENVSGSA